MTRIDDMTLAQAMLALSYEIDQPESAGTAIRAAGYRILQLAALRATLLDALMTTLVFFDQRSDYEGIEQASLADTLRAAVRQAEQALDQDEAQPQRRRMDKQ